MQNTDHPLELSFRGAILGAAMTAVFLAANVYLGLKTGMTFSSSIPAAVISMSVLRMFGRSGILENNIVQTQASAAGTLCNVILVLPGLLLINYWHGFPLWQTMAICLVGGLLGVAYSVPLRRVMVVNSNLPFPEGVAAAEVLRAGHREESGKNEEGNEGGLKDLLISAGAAAFLNLVIAGLKLLPDKLEGSFIYGSAVFRMGGSLSLALIGAGYLVRIGACLALFLGLFIAWGVAVPVLMATAPPPAGDLAAAAEAVWSGKVRLIGAGIMAAGGLWTVITLIKPMIESVRAALQSEAGSAELHRPRQDRDIPMIWVGAAIAALCVLAAGLFAWFASGVHLPAPFAWLVIAITLLTTVLGLFMASACGYMAGLLGSSCSPISGIGILSTILVAAGFGSVFSQASAGERQAAVALTIFMTSMIVTTSSIANDNLQDLKTGNLVGAMPWRQQAALAIGVAIGAITIAPVLQVLYEAYGFAGSLPRPDMHPGNVMAAPQATLITQIANGIVYRQLPWDMVYIGACIGVALVALESWLRRKGYSLPALTVGIGIYLPASVSLTIAAGGLIGWLTERAVARRTAGADSLARQQEAAKVRRRGVLIASGFLAGESLAGVFIAATDAVSGRSGSLAFLETGQTSFAAVAGFLVFACALAVFFRSAVRPV